MASADTSPETILEFPADLPSPAPLFEKLPDEILLSFCRYLSSVEVLDSFLNLNARLNRTIAAYREKIFLHHLSHRDFHHLLDDHLPILAANVTYLHINARSMQHSGRFFEQRFPKMDQQFPALRKLVFRHIDTDTLESLAWRFNTMNNLHTLDIDIADERLPSVPAQFDEFLCGKLFSEANSFRTLALHLNTYKFNLQSLRSKCLNLRRLTISVRHFDDLLVLFERCRHLEHLTITVGCSAPSTQRTDTYPYEQLWWRMAYLTHFSLSIEAKELTAHEHVPPSDILLKTIANLFPLTCMKFQMNISFATALPVHTTKEQYTSKYLPYVDGHGWQQALHRQDNHSIRFEMHIELDGLANYYSQNINDVDMLFIQKNNDVDFNALLRPTFSDAFWLQKNIDVQCVTTASKHISIYTLPLHAPTLSTMVDTIDRAIAVNAFPSHLHESVRALSIGSEPGYQSPTVSLRDLFLKLPHLIRLECDKQFHLPPPGTICSTRLRSLSLRYYTLSACCSLLCHLPNVMSLSLLSVGDLLLHGAPSLQPIPAVTRLRIVLHFNELINLPDLPALFPNVAEFHLMVKGGANRSIDDQDAQNDKVKFFLLNFKQLRYVEVFLPLQRDYLSISKWFSSNFPCQPVYSRTADSNAVVFRHWLHQRLCS